MKQLQMSTEEPAGAAAQLCALHHLGNASTLMSEYGINLTGKATTADGTDSSIVVTVVAEDFELHAHKAAKLVQQTAKLSGKEMSMEKVCQRY